jgi:hypothetical protein
MIAAAADAVGLAQLWVWEDCVKESGIATATAAAVVRFAGFLAREVAPLVS